MIPITDNNSRTIARAFLAVKYPNHSLRLFQGEYFDWRTAGGIYFSKPKEVLRSEKYSVMEQMAVVDEDGEVVEQIIPNKRRVDDVMDAMASLCIADVEKMPAFLDKHRPDPKDIITFQNGLLNISKFLEDPTIPLIPPTPAWFSTNGLPFRFDPLAPRPAAWCDEFLPSIFDSRGEIELLQSWFGYVLSGDTRQQKILMLVGPPRSGKGTIARVLTALLGASNIVAPTLSSLSTNFGLWGWMRAMLAIISDARLSGRSDIAIIVERLLSISGEDWILIDRKNMAPITMQLLTRIMILSNELPSLNDSSGALAERLLILNLTKSFLGKEDTGLTDRLYKELPGILLWSLDGLRKIRQQGKFILPESSAAITDELRDLVSPIRAFIRDACIVGPGRSISVQKLFEAWGIWCSDNGRKGAGSVHTFGRDLRAGLPALRQVRPQTEDGERVRCYEGVDLSLAFAQHVAVEVSVKDRSAHVRDHYNSTSREGDSHAY